MNYLFLDLETAQATNESIIKDITDNIQPPKTIKLEASKQKWFKEKSGDAIKEAISKTSFDGWAGELVSIGFAVDEEDSICFIRKPGESEKRLINDFFDYLTQEYGVNFNPLWVAHNVEFDLPFLYKRMVVNNVKPPIPFPVMPKAWDKHVFCTMHNSTAGKPGGSLNRISKILGLGQKTEGIDGSQINQAWLDGRNVEIAEYNRQDVDLCRAIYKRLTFTENLSDTLNPLKEVI